MVYGNSYLQICINDSILYFCITFAYKTSIILKHAKFFLSPSVALLPHSARSGKSKFRICPLQSRNFPEMKFFYYLYSGIQGASCVLRARTLPLRHRDLCRIVYSLTVVLFRKPANKQKLGSHRNDHPVIYRCGYMTVIIIW